MQRTVKGILRDGFKREVVPEVSEGMISGVQVAEALLVPHLSHVHVELAEALPAANPEFADWPVERIWVSKAMLNESPDLLRFADQEVQCTFDEPTEWGDTPTALKIEPA